MRQMPDTYNDRQGQGLHPDCPHRIEGCSCDLCIGVSRCTECHEPMGGCDCYARWLEEQFMPYGMEEELDEWS